MKDTLDEILGLVKKKETIDFTNNLNVASSINIGYPNYKSKLNINNGTMIVWSDKPVPNWFNRLILKILLGWTWEKD